MQLSRMAQQQTEDIATFYQGAPPGGFWYSCNKQTNNSGEVQIFMRQYTNPAMVFGRMSNLLLISRHESVSWEDSLSNLRVVNLLLDLVSKLFSLFMKPPQKVGSVDHSLRLFVL